MGRRSCLLREVQAPAFLNSPLQVSTCLAVGEDGGGVATGHPDGSVRLWDLRAGAGAGSVLAAGSWVSGLVYCGPLLAASTHDGNLRLFDTRKAKAM